MTFTSLIFVLIQFAKMIFAKATVAATATKLAVISTLADAAPSTRPRTAIGVPLANPRPLPQISRPNIAIPQIMHQLTDPAQFMSVNVFPLPDTISVNVVSAAGAGALATRVYIFNQDILNNITNNGSGAGSITYAYQDGFNGNVISTLLAFSRAGLGAIIYGFYLRLVVTATRAGDPTGLGTANPFFAVNNAYGQPIPVNTNMTADQTRGDFDTSLDVNNVFINLSRFCQFTFIIPVADTANVTLYTTNNFKR